MAYTLDALMAQLSLYLRDALGATTVVSPWKEEGSLAFFLRDRYRVLEAQVLGHPCLLMADLGDGEVSAATVRKHVDQVLARSGGSVIYVRERITAYNRKRLVEQQVPFIVPGNQMYLPMLGIDFREHFRRPPQPSKGIRPSTQALLIYALYQDVEDLGPTALAARLGYSAMAMSQALDELEAAGIGESTSMGRGRSRCLRFDSSKKDVWNLAEPLLHTPVKSRQVIRLTGEAIAPGPHAGLSALAEYSMLAEPENATHALSRRGWKSLERRTGVTHVPADEPGSVTLEVWSYDPALFAQDGRVDRLSLYLSLRDHRDERVQAALDQVLETVPW